MSLNEYNKKAITDTYKNAHIALQSISDLLPDVEDSQLKDLLSEQYEGYNQVIEEIKEYMCKEGLETKEINPMKKAMLWGSIKMKTMMNNSRNQIAEMMIKGSVMGINELTAMKNESSRLNEEVKKHVEKLLQLEEEYTDQLKRFL